MRYIVEPSKKLTGCYQVPGDKSISHRAIMLGAIAQGTTTVSGFLAGQDPLATIAAFQAMGIQINHSEDQVTIKGAGLHGLNTPQQTLDMGNSGTSMRLISGLLAPQKFNSTLSGDASLSKRPMNRVITPLKTMNAKITSQDGKPPLEIQGTPSLQGVEYSLPMASAQVKSCMLLAGLYAQGKTSVIEPEPTRDHTERMLQAFGYPLKIEGPKVTITPGHSLNATHIEVPADISSAAFFIVGASIATDSNITLTNVGVNPRRIGIINILKQMGANIEITNKRKFGGEPVADLKIQSANMHGIDIPPEQVPLAIDELPAVMIAAACAKGTTRLTQAEELRVKESDRLQLMADGLSALGIKSELQHDGITIHGQEQFNGGVIDSHGDHRIAMAFSIASLRATKNIHINNCENVATSFPNFVSLSNQAGLSITEQDTIEAMQ